MGVNSLPKTVTRQHHDCDLNPRPSESSTLTTWLPSHPNVNLQFHIMSDWWSSEWQLAETCCRKSHPISQMSVPEPARGNIDQWYMPLKGVVFTEQLGMCCSLEGKASSVAEDSLNTRQHLLV